MIEWPLGCYIWGVGTVLLEASVKTPDMNIIGFLQEKVIIKIWISVMVFCSKKQRYGLEVCYGDVRSFCFCYVFNFLFIFLWEQSG